MKKLLTEVDYRDVLRALSKNHNRPKDKKSVMYAHKKLRETIEASIQLAENGNYRKLSPQGNETIIAIPDEERTSSFAAVSNLSTLSQWMNSKGEDSGIRPTSINRYVLSSTLTTLLFDSVKFQAFKGYILDAYEDLPEAPFLSADKYKADFIQTICEHACQNLEPSVFAEKKHSRSSTSLYSFEALEELLYHSVFTRVRSSRKNEITWHSSNITYQLQRSGSFIDSLINVKSSVENLIHIYKQIGKFPFAEGQINTDINDHSMHLDISMSRSSTLSYEKEILLLNTILEATDSLSVAYRHFSDVLDPDLSSNTFDSYDQNKQIFVNLPEDKATEYQRQTNHFDYEYRYGKYVMSKLEIPLAIMFSGLYVSNLSFDINVSLPIDSKTLFFRYLLFLDDDLETYRYFSQTTGFSHSKSELPDKSTGISVFSTRLVLDNDFPHIILLAHVNNLENQTRAIKSVIKFVGRIIRCIDESSVPTICLEQLRKISRVQKENRYKNISSAFEASFLYSEVFELQRLYQGYSDCVVEKGLIAYTDDQKLPTPIHIRFFDNRIVSLYGYYQDTEVLFIEKEYKTFDDIKHIINSITLNESYTAYCSRMKAE